VAGVGLPLLRYLEVGSRFRCLSLFLTSSAPPPASLPFKLETFIAVGDDAV